MKREQYATGLAVSGNVGVTVGISYEDATASDVAALADTAQRFGRVALASWGSQHTEIVATVQALVDRYYPNRPFYVETDEDGRGVQVFQPYGMPQDGSKDDSDVSTGGCRYDSCGSCGTYK